jgi:hypothetical protein
VLCLGTIFGDGFFHSGQFKGPVHQFISSGLFVILATEILFSVFS